MKEQNFREELVEMVKAAGQEMIDRAEDLVGETDMISDFDIWVRFSIDGRRLDEVPKIEVTKSFVSKQAINVLCKRYNG